MLDFSRFMITRPTSSPPPPSTDLWDWVPSQCAWHGGEDSHGTVADSRTCIWPTAAALGGPQVAQGVGVPV